MARRGPTLAELQLSEDERATLERWSRRPKSEQSLALRCKIVLACAEGLSNGEVAERLGGFNLNSRRAANGAAGLSSGDSRACTTSPVRAWRASLVTTTSRPSWSRP